MSSFMEELLGVTFSTEKEEETVLPTALTIAGSDSGGGAGMQADLKSFAAQQVHGTSVLTLVTAQNTKGVSQVQMMPESLVRAQYEAVVTDFAPSAAKTGALGNERMISFVHELFQDHAIDKLVVDPVMVSKHGESLMAESARRVMLDALVPHALVLTPNRYEAQVLTGRRVEGPSSMKEAAKQLFDHGARFVLMKGSHLDRIVRDLVYDGTGFVEFGADRIDTDRVHGSGCVLSATITARLALGDEVLEAINFAREFISGAIEHAPKLGHGISPVHPLYKLWDR